MQPRYVTDPFEEEDNNSKISVKAREGKTPLQTTALNATKRPRFKDKAEHDAFKKFEAFSAGADPESRVWAAWLANRIEIAESYNKKTIIVTMPNLIKSFGNEQKREIWFTDHREEVLRKVSAMELATNLSINTGTDNMEKAMQRRMNNDNH